MFTKPPPVQPAITVQDPPSVEEVHAEASASSASARFIFQTLIEDLEDANECFDAVEQRTTSEITRLTELRDDAITQRRKNLATIQAVQALAGE